MSGKHILTNIAAKHISVKLTQSKYFCTKSHKLSMKIQDAQYEIVT